MGKGVTFDVSLDVVFTAPYGTKQAEVWLPVPKDDNAQQVEAYRTEPGCLSDETEPLYNNHLVHFSYDKPQGGQIIKQSFKVTTHEMRWDLDPEKATIVREWPESFARYLRNEQNVVVDERAKELARKIVGEEKNPVRQAHLLMAWIMKTLNYDHNTCSLEASSVWALDKKVGHCSDYHGLATALGRAVGIPGRVTYGINPLPKNSPTHCKVEFYFAGYGWVSFDISETQKMVKKIEKDTTLEAAAKSEKIKSRYGPLRKRLPRQHLVQGRPGNLLSARACARNRELLLWSGQPISKPTASLCKTPIPAMATCANLPG